jgi:hypothetical protein
MSRDGGRWLPASLVAGGALVMAGALVPWLTLYAGLYGYRGTTGLYGWVVFGAGALACAIGLGAHRFGPPWLGWASAALGGGLLGFTAWLLAGLVTILRRPSAAMLAPRPGPGLFLVLAGATLILLAPVGQRALGRRGIGAR